jgi:acyl-CoA thioesterase I
VLAGDGLTRSRMAVAQGRLKILAIGSSSIAGWGASRYENGFVPLLQTELRSRLPSVQVEVVNRGVGGETARETVARLEAEVAFHRPHLVIWQVGTNDVMRARPWNDVAVDLQRGEDILARANVDVLLIDPQRLPPDEINVNTRGRNDALGEAARLIALEGDRVGYAVQRRFDAMANWSRLTRGGVGPDDLHLNDEGYACWAAITGEGLAAALR